MPRLFLLFSTLLASVAQGDSRAATFGVYSGYAGDLSTLETFRYLLLSRGDEGKIRFSIQVVSAWRNSATGLNEKKLGHTEGQITLSGGAGTFTYPAPEKCSLEFRQLDGGFKVAQSGDCAQHMDTLGAVSFDAFYGTRALHDGESKPVAGEYRLDLPGFSGNLSVSEVTALGFHFVIGVSGSNGKGAIEQNARVVDGFGFFDDPATAGIRPGGCLLDFRFKSGRVRVNQTSLCRHWIANPKVLLTGEYVKE